MAKCSDPKVGALLHAYELNALSEEEMEEFELHLMVCDYCHSEIQSFENSANIMLDHEPLRVITRDAVSNATRSESLLKRLCQYLWPNTPFLFRPAIAYLIVLLLVIPARYGIYKYAKDDDKPIPVITTDSSKGFRQAISLSLTPVRSGERNILQYRPGCDVVINFTYREATQGKHYNVSIVSNDGVELLKIDEFNSFDSYGQGVVTISQDNMIPGSYRLIISDPQSDELIDSQEYLFEIIK